MINNIIKLVREAKDNFGDFVHETPLDYSTTFSKLSGNTIYLKLENLQKTGSFKIRGALNKINKLNDSEKKNGVVTASAGNHGQAVALSASLNNIRSTVVIPESTPIIKAEAIENYGAKVIIHGDNYDEAFDHALKIQKKEGLTFIQAFNDEDVIIGQGTIGLEILEKLPETDIIIVPVGGGGLISGISSYCKAIKPSIKIIGVEAAGSPSMYQSLKKGEIIKLKEIKTIADGIAIKKPGDITFNIIKELVDEIVLVDDDEIASAVLLLLERAKLVVEGSGAVSLAAALKIKEKDKNIVALLSGGNIDINLISRIISRGLNKTGRIFTFTTKVIDKPGALFKLLEIIKNEKGNILKILHDRNKREVPIQETIVEIELETKDENHIKKIKDSLVKQGYEIEEIKY